MRKDEFWQEVQRGMLRWQWDGKPQGWLRHWSSLHDRWKTMLRDYRYILGHNEMMPSSCKTYFQMTPEQREAAGLKKVLLGSPQLFAAMHEVESGKARKPFLTIGSGRAPPLSPHLAVPANVPLKPCYQKVNYMHHRLISSMHAAAGAHGTEVAMRTLDDDDGFEEEDLRQMAARSAPSREEQLGEEEQDGGENDKVQCAVLVCVMPCRVRAGSWPRCAVWRRGC